MRIAIVVSKKDEAGLNIKQTLLDLGDFEKTDEEFDGNEVYQLNNLRLYSAEPVSIDCDHADSIEADMVVFATKHESASGVPSLSVHSPGNWGKAELGGKDGRLCVAPARYLKSAMIMLEKNVGDLKYEVMQEATHHGPYIEKPCFFIEIGSSHIQWRDRKAAETIAKTLMQVLTKEPPEARAAFGIGGLHHTPNFKDIILKSDIAVGHVCPKYNLQNLDKEMMVQAIKKTQEKVQLIAVDWKGLGQEKQRIVEILNQIKSEMNIDWKKTRELK